MRLLIPIVFVLWIAGTAAQAARITVAAAISMKDSLARVAEAYRADGGEEVEFTFGSSGQMAAQIKAGAPIDLFVSAAQKQMEELKSARLIDDASVRVIAANSLVLIVPAGASQPPGAFADLADARFKRVAVGQPKTVPAGDYAAQTLAFYHLDASLSDRLVFGINVRQVLTYVTRGEVDAGIVYATDAKEAGEKVKVVATAPSQSHQPIVYPAGVVRASAHGQDAARFLQYLSGEKAQGILGSFGFSRPVSGATTAPATLPAGHP